MSSKAESPATPLAPAHAALVDAVSERLRALFDADAAGAGVAGSAAAQGPEAQYQARMKAERAEEDARPLHPIERFPCHSPTTGNAFVAVVTRKMRDGEPDPRFPDGQITSLERYELCEAFQAKIPPKIEGPVRAQWLWAQGYQADLRAFVGKGASALLTARDDLKEKLEAFTREAAASPAAVAK